uniref:Uncharacterized protein n=1 Tax=Anguilla anguilla TaxID=7936 RepID=A0A0E9WUM0_ANGAN
MHSELQPLTSDKFLRFQPLFSVFCHRVAHRECNCYRKIFDILNDQRGIGIKNVDPARFFPHRFDMWKPLPVSPELVMGMTSQRALIDRTQEILIIHVPVLLVSTGAYGIPLNSQ